MRLATAGIVSLSDFHKRKRSTKSCKVLVADGEQANHGTIAKQLEAAGHDVKLVADGDQVLDALIEANYDVVILGANISVTAGLEATRLIRVMQAGQMRVPVIMLSPDATPQTMKEATDAGVNVFLSKSADANKLYETVERLTKKRSEEIDTLQR